MHYNDKFYLTDSHSCGPNGESVVQDFGRACIIECNTLAELERMCKQSTGSQNQQFTINYIKVNIKYDPVLECVREEEEREEENTYSIAVDAPSEQTEYVSVQTSVMAQIDFREPDIEQRYELSDELNKIVRKTKNNIVNVHHELRAEEFSWFYLFPFGINGLRETSRRVKISHLDYFQFRILGKDTRFQRNDYLFYALSMFENECVRATISACGKKIEGENGMVDKFMSDNGSLSKITGIINKKVSGLQYTTFFFFRGATTHY